MVFIWYTIESLDSLFKPVKNRSKKRKLVFQWTIERIINIEYNKRKTAFRTSKTCQTLIYFIEHTAKKHRMHKTKNEINMPMILIIIQIINQNSRKQNTTYLDDHRK